MGFFRGLFSLLGRLMLCSYFVWLAIRYFLMFDETVALCESAGITQAEGTLVGAIVGLGVGCLLIVTGIAARFGALLILIYLGAYLYFFQPFWTVPAAERLPHIMEALQTIALAGAMVIIAGNGAGAGALTSSRNSMDLFDDLGR